MLQRLFNSTKWIWCIVIISAGSTWGPWGSANAVSVPKQNTPSAIEAQAKFFQDFFSVQLSPYKIEFGHVCEDPNNWEQRYEKKDFKNHRDMGKVRWGDKKGGYGEHYWDLNHAGHGGNDDGYDSDSDDGSYHEDPRDISDESHERSQNYEIDEYNPDDTNNNYDETGRAKRAHEKLKSNQSNRDKVDNEQEQHPKEKMQRNDEEKLEENVNEEEVTNRPFKIKPKRRLRQQYVTEAPQNKEKNNIVLVIKHKENEKDDKVDLPKQSEPKHFVPYEGGAGVRQPVPPELVASASIPRLFLDQSSGYVIDRSTGQAFMLQPIPRNIRYS
ncbi:uncharacterized protein LOC124530604 [Vanessa cardui]|uniref:uncharacterized protein LOC124530604 n=1 Tax=Vanessa cardui TaxID=171605 RepID=UPI001F13DAA8|nr:uncharacterized protein LOC124530604 [Vanessa cardui]